MRLKIWWCLFWFAAFAAFAACAVDDALFGAAANVCEDGDPCTRNWGGESRPGTCRGHDDPDATWVGCCDGCWQDGMCWQGDDAPRCGTAGEPCHACGAASSASSGGAGSTSLSSTSSTGGGGGSGSTGGTGGMGGTTGGTGGSSDAGLEAGPTCAPSCPPRQACVIGDAGPECWGCVLTTAVTCGVGFTPVGYACPPNFDPGNDCVFINFTSLGFLFCCPW